MPTNTLSGMLNGTRYWPEKWKEKPRAFVEARAKATTPEPTKAPAVPVSTKRITVDENTPPPGLSKAQQIRWHRENNQTLR
jgi:hypothetical protein